MPDKGNKTGTTYRAIESELAGLFPTKDGYIEFVIKPLKLDMSWIVVNNKSVKAGQINDRNHSTAM